MIKTSKAILAAITIAAVITSLQAPARKQVLEPSYAWITTPPLGTREPSTIDTLYENYSLEFVPQLQSNAYAATGNYCAEGLNMLYMKRPQMGNFWFHDAVANWLPSQAKTRFYNTRIPMTLLSYNFGGGKQDGQDRFTTQFSANANARTQVGAMIDYIYSKGSYDYQAAKDLTWGFSGSYIGERVEFQGYYFHYNLVTKENGGITDDAFITDPASVQGGNTSVNCKEIPVNLTAAHNRVKGTELYLNSRYKMGFWREEQVNDTTVNRTLVPVTSIIWTLQYTDGQHRFRNDNAQENLDFWPQTYLCAEQTNDFQSYWTLRNTVGISLLEGFNKYAKAGASLFLTHEVRHYNMESQQTQPNPSLADAMTALLLNPMRSQTQNGLWAGMELTRRSGRILNYDAIGEIGFLGHAIGEVKLNGNIYTKVPLGRDSLEITAFGRFTNLTAPWLTQHYFSNHYVWENDFGKTRSLRFGGCIALPRTSSALSLAVENVQNQIYFGPDAMPRQNGGSVQILSASLHQNLKASILHWDNAITYQTSSDQTVVPLPQLAVNSNLYILFHIATLKVQFGINCDYFTKYKGVAFQPASMVFYNQDTTEIGNYPFITAYLNCKLSRARFYVMMSHVNQGLTGTNYFSMPHYPMNPRRLQLGVSIDFAN